MSAFAVGAVEFDVVWRSFGYGLPPLVLDVPSPGATYTERAVIEQNVWAELVRRGLAEQFGKPMRTVEDAFALIMNRTRAVELRAGELRALLAVGNRRAVLVVLTDQLRFSTAPDTGLAATIVDVLPQAPAGRGRSVTVPAETLAAAESAESAVARQAVLQRGGLTRGDARALSDMTAGATEIGQFAVEARDTRGDARRGDRVIGFYRNDSGRYQVVRRGDHLTVTPASAGHLAESVHRLLDELDRQPA